MGCHIYLSCKGYRRKEIPVPSVRLPGTPFWDRVCKNKAEVKALMNELKSGRWSRPAGRGVHGYNTYRFNSGYNLKALIKIERMFKEGRHILRCN